MKEKKKVLHIAEAMGGGVFTYLVELANGMCEEFDVTIAFGMRSETPKNYEEYFDKRISLIKVNHFTRGLNPIKDLGAYFELRKIIRQITPDIVHLHSSKAGAIGRMMFAGKKRVMFYTPHGYSFLMEDIPNIKRKIYYNIEKICGKKNCITVACGESEWERGKKVSRKSTFISNGINISKVQKSIELAKKIQEKDKRFTVYTVGRADFQKNPELFNEIAKRLPHIDFVWIGDGELRNQLTSSNIRITGWLENAEVLNRAKDYNVFILTSRYEGLPISLLEAMYMRKLCVVSNVVGNRDVIRNNHSGYVCDNLEQFVEVIGMLEKDGIEERIVNHSYDSVINHFNSGWLVEKYKELYNEELEKNIKDRK